MGSKIDIGGPHMQVPPPWFKPWPHQEAMMKAILIEKKREVVSVWHRRGGKDLAAMITAQVCLFEDPGIYWHLLPTYAQGKKVIWKGIDNEGRKFMDYWPRANMVSARNDEMMIEYSLPQSDGTKKSGIYQVIGGDKVDAAVGANPKGIIFSEWSLMNPLALDLMRPMVEANEGWMIFPYTPRGSNHGLELLEMAKKNGWFWEVLDISQTTRSDGRPIITSDRFEQIKKEEIDKGGDGAVAEQEYHCSFTAPMQGAYFGKEMEDADTEGRICELRWERELPVFTCWDLGYRDTMVIWFYQIVDGWVHWFDYYASFGRGIEHYVGECFKRPYVYKAHYSPHDSGHHSVQTGKTLDEVASKLGLRFTRVRRTTSLDNDIQAVRLALRKSKFDRVKCDHGIKALREYSRKWDANLRTWGAKPSHNWASHPVDAFRTGAVVMPNIVPGVKKPTLYPLEQTFDELMTWHDQKTNLRESQVSFRRV